MTELRTDLAAGLETLVGREAPPCAVDIAMARTRGLVSRKRRRTAVIGSAISGSAFVAALISTVLINMAAPGSNLGQYGRTDASPFFGVGANLTGTDPFLQTTVFGWLPAGAQEIEQEHVHVLDPGIDADGLSFFVRGTNIKLLQLTVFPHGTTLPTPPGGNSAPAVNGRVAGWLIAPGAGAAQQLQWEYADGSWAQITVNVQGQSSTDLTALIYRVAENVRYDQNIEIPAPFHVAKAPTGLPVASGSAQLCVGATSAYSCPSFDETVAFAEAGGVDQADDNGVYITAALATPGPIVRPSPDSAQTQTPLTVGGRPAELVVAHDNETLTVHDVDGLDITVAATGAGGVAALVSAGGIITYYQSLTLLGSDPKNWSTAVVG